MRTVSFGTLRPTRMTRGACLLLLVLSSAGTASFAQFAKDQLPLPPAAGPGVAGELWSVTTLQEFYGRGDREPSKRDRQQNLVCYARGAVGVGSAANAELPNELKDKCWLSDKRTEPLRQQTKYACNDGMSAEVATRQEADGSYGSQVVVNMPEQGGISVTRTMRRMPGVCDASIKAPNPPAQPTPPAKPLIDTPPKKSPRPRWNPAWARLLAAKCLKSRANACSWF